MEGSEGLEGARAPPLPLPQANGNGHNGRGSASPGRARGSPAQTTGCADALACRLGEAAGACAAGANGVAVDAGMAAIACFYGFALVAIDVWDRKLSHRMGNCWLVRRCGRDARSSLFVRGSTAADLPGSWSQLLRGGQVWTALILSTSYSEKYKGRFMRTGASAPVQLPVPVSAGPGLRTTWSPKLLHRVGNPSAAAFIWVGDEDAGDQTIYVAFSMMRKFGQAKHILLSTLQRGLAEELDGGSPLEGSGNNTRVEAEPQWENLRVASYMRQKIDALWVEHGFCEKLAQTAAEHEGYRIVFGGMSHGAALAQASALRFNLSGLPYKAHAVSWNAYKWTDAAGSEVAGRCMGEHLLPLVLTRWIPGRGDRPGYRCWDSIAGCPAGFEPMPQIRLLDVDTGAFLPCETQQDCPGNSHLSTWDAFKRLWRLHYAAMAIVATRAAMQAAAIHT